MDYQLCYQCHYCVNAVDEEDYHSEAFCVCTYDLENSVKRELRIISAIDEICKHYKENAYGKHITIG